MDDLAASTGPYKNLYNHACARDSEREILQIVEQALRALGPPSLARDVMVSCHQRGHWIHVFVSGLRVAAGTGQGAEIHVVIFHGHDQGVFPVCISGKLEHGFIKQVRG